MGRYLTVLMLACAVGALTCAGCDTPAGKSGSPAAANLPALGETGILSNGAGTDDVLVARSEQAQQKLTQAAAAKDREGWQQIAGSQAYQVSYGTKARNLGFGSFGIMHVRILEGHHAGEEGWIPAEWLQKP